MIDFSQYNNETINKKLHQARDILAQLIQTQQQDLAEYKRKICDEKEAEIRAIIEGLERAQARKGKLGHARDILTRLIEIDKKGMTASQIENYINMETTMRELIEMLEKEHFNRTIEDADTFIREEEEHLRRYQLFIEGGEPWKEK